MKICFFEFTATPETSPRYISGGSFRTLGTESNGISGTSPARNGLSAAAPAHANAISKVRFKVASFGTPQTIPNAGRECIRAPPRLIRGLPDPILDGIAKQLAPRLLGTPGETLGAREYLVRTGIRRLHTIRITSLGSATAQRLWIPFEFPPPPPASSTALRSSCAPATRRRLGLRGAGTG